MNVFPTLLPSSSTLPLTLMASLCIGTSAFADGTHEHHHPSKTGFHLDFGIGLQWVTADKPWPIARLPGVLEAGSEREDERTLRFSYIELGASYVFNPQAKAVFNIAKHDLRLKPEIEAAYVEYQGIDLKDFRLDVQLGRQQVPIGLLNQQEKHAWLMGVAPIAMRAVLNDSWRSDGINLHFDSDSPWYFGVGAWANRFVPGGEIPQTAINTYTAKLGWQGRQGALASQYEIGYANLDVLGRALSTIGAERHTHSLPSCETIDENRVCFAGEVHLVTGSAKWKRGDYWLSSEVFYKKEQGELDSFYGVPDYQSEYFGSWLDFGWQINSRLSTLLRLQYNQTNHQINGTNAQLISEQAKIIDSDNPLSAIGVAFAYQAGKAHFVSAETHVEKMDDYQNRVLLVRYHLNYNIL
ncbi:hypothetical protein [Thiomicrorhabdus indica]|uniref:hypothetical protein n=1 Tax=Thiomicrorhabdus indica TaxID=2267253 RepID=UPI00102D6E45|nr:hypothetical protein [Thiomicrorhabdus indica]